MLNVIEANITNRLNKIGNSVPSLMPSFITITKEKAAISNNKDNIPNFFRGLIKPKNEGNILYSIPNIITSGNNN